ncbi:MULTISPECIES: sodium/solute symporter [unclassified Flavobacterium]|uniref:sodium:solute symporter family transporter n=1 Tax=unclassified Flavobacterium TaxID=196869 RepID=UPI001F148A1C|nr:MULTISPECIES: sodium/solute symporter [unclassified Flavobacterium]UMY66635.1 sodium/solute symporter [Flavobacterium sp. HJ-32-4]
MNTFSTVDYAVFITYFFLVAGYGYWVYRRKKEKGTSESTNFFLAEGSLTWWAIGASLIASNISAEQFIGASGQGFTVGLAIAAYEWVAAIALIVVAVWFIPVYLKNRIFTMPQFLERRYNQSASLIMAVFWLFLYVFVNLTSILYLGALAINNMAGGEYFHLIVVVMAVFALIITLGGMKVIGFTDVIQVVVLVIGGLATTYIALCLVGEHFGLGSDAWAGFTTMMHQAPDHFKMIFDKPGPNSSQEDIDKYLLLPGVAMYFAGQWITNLNYWGCNQYITQRALGADLKTARTGILFAGFMKLAMPIIVMLPGIAAYVIWKDGGLQAEMAAGGEFSADNAYSSILGFLPAGLKGLSLAALTAAIVASLAGKANSISTIYTLDIYKKYINTEASEKKLVLMGRIAILVAMVLSVVLTWNDTLGIGMKGGFTFIQKYTGFVSPGVFAMFILGMFWKRTTGAAAITGLIAGFLFSIFFNMYAVDWFGAETWLWTAFRNSEKVYEIPFLIGMGWTFLFTVLLMVGVSLAGPKHNPKAFEIDSKMFRVAPSTLALIVLTLLIFSVLYVRFW